MRTTLDIWKAEMALNARRRRRETITNWCVFALDCAGFVIFIASCVMLPGHP